MQQIANQLLLSNFIANITAKTKKSIHSSQIRTKNNLNQKKSYQYHEKKLTVRLVFKKNDKWNKKKQTKQWKFDKKNKKTTSEILI